MLAAMLRDQPDSSESQEARWRLGLAYLEDGEPTEASLALELARQDLPEDALPPEVDFWLGEAYSQVGAPLLAVEAYQRYLAREDLLAGEVNLRIGRLLREAGDTESAVEALNQAITTAPDNFVLFAAQEELAQLYGDLEDWQAALAQYDQIVARSESERYRAQIHYQAGQVLEQAGRAEEAVGRYRQAVAEDEGSFYALQAADALALREQPLDAYTYARILLANSYYGDGTAAMYRYLDAVPNHPAEPHLLVAEAYFDQRQYSSAVAEWQVLLDTHPEYTDRAGVLMRMAEAQRRLDDSVQGQNAARALYRQAATASTIQAPAALLEAARIAERNDDFETAATEYLAVASQYPAASEAGEALYRAGISQYRLGLLASALENWQRLISGYPDNIYAHAGRFWGGKTSLELGNPEQALELWQGLAGEAGDSYYTARAAELANQAGLDTTELGPVDTDQPQSDQIAETEAWLAQWAAPGSESQAPLRQLPPAVANDVQLQRGEAYLRAGLRGEALREFDAIYDRYKDDPLAMFALALHFRDLGAYKHATLAGVRLGALAPGGLFQAPLPVQQLAYPTYFAELVQAEALARNLDPLLIYALIRQESFFERGARSYAAAQGLTQVIPSTAEWIANAIDWPNFQPGDIYKPYINVKFGTYYLYAALETFDGNPYPALVGYNAGPGNARFWLEATGSDDNELFVEEVTLAEPKLYVRRVLAHYFNYQRLYGTPSDLGAQG